MNAHRLWMAALTACFAVACTDPLARMDRLTGAISVGSEYCNWTPSDTSTSFDMAVGFEVKEAVGIQLSVSPEWSDDPYTPSVGEEGLEGVMTATSGTPDLIDVFSGPGGTFGVLAKKPGNATLVFQLAGHPGTITAPVVIVPSDQFVDRDEAGNGSSSSSGGSSSSSGGSSSSSSGDVSSSSSSSGDAGTDGAPQGGG